MADAKQGSGRPRGRRALGRGLDALLPVVEETDVRQIDVDRIEPNPQQPRQRFERSSLEALAASIREHGVIQPLVVAAAGDDRYRLIVGERRWQAARLAGLLQVPVIVKDSSDRQTLELALIENIQRADLNALEEAVAYQRLIQDFGLTQQQVADQVGRSRAAVTNTLRLLGLPELLKQAIVEGRISEGHARAVLGLPDRQLQIAALERIERENLTVRQTEDAVRRLLKASTPDRVGRSRSPDLEVIEDELRRALGTKVTVRQSKRGGRIVIEYYSEDEFQELYRVLLREHP